eukprot:179322-Chlamydomonas_euryale.AAC.1
MCRSVASTTPGCASRSIASSALGSSRPRPARSCAANARAASSRRPPIHCDSRRSAAAASGSIAPRCTAASTSRHCCAAARKARAVTVPRPGRPTSSIACGEAERTG